MSELTSKEIVRPLADRLLEACVAGCTCLTKTPDHQHHDQMCTYRLHMESMFALSGPKVLTLHGFEIMSLVDFLGGDPDTEVSIAHYEAAKDVETGEDMPAGHYAWCTDYPEEGRVPLSIEPPKEPASAPEPPADQSPIQAVDVLMNVLRHCDVTPEGETAFEKDVLAARRFVADYAARSIIAGYGQPTPPPPVGREPPHCPTCSCDVCVCPNSDTIDTEHCPVHRSRPTKRSDAG